ncbi:hypothetical protein NDU88_003866 [Pleurodeles waltl]|uniref:Uncharacterized protein n=1 Tax=Pleurodeles waltl TaxID=8319 RepID=A0AAV7QAX1_PLEWA|nr:hypothetical protein NDU88_003866 [Pleurodeles waltl]
MQRAVRDTIPQVETPTETPGQARTRQKQVETRLQQRRIYNERMSRKRRARTRNLTIGDVVLVKTRHPGGKFKTPFESSLWTVTRVKGTLVTATRGSESVTRNISCFKTYHGDQRDRQGSENDSGQYREDEEDREDEEFRRPSTSAEGCLMRGPSQTREGREEDKITALDPPAQIEEGQLTEVPSENSRNEVVQQRGMGRYNLRSRTSPPERLKDYICE